MADEFLTFDEALEALRMREDDLKRLISEGDIRAFRAGDSVQLRRADIDRLAEESGEETLEDEEIVFEEAGEEDFDLVEADDDVGMTTTPISEADTLLDDEAIEDLGEEIDLVDEEADAPEEAEEDAEDAAAGKVAVQRSRKRSDALRGKAGETVVGEAGWERGLVLATAVVLILCFAVVWSATTTTPNFLSEPLMNMFKG